MKGMTLAAATRALGGEPPRAILCGTVATCLSNAAMAAKKAENYDAHRALYPEFRSVWLGDSGQGDIETGLHMLRAHQREQEEADAGAGAGAATATAAASSESGRGGVCTGVGASGSLAGSEIPRPLPRQPAPLVLIHDLSHSSQAPYTGEAKRAAWRHRGVHLFGSYAEAACVAAEAGLLSAGRLQAVVDATAAELAAAKFPGGERQRLARLQEFQGAARRAQAARPAHRPHA